MQLKYFKIVRDIWQQFTSNCREQLPTYDHFKVVKVRALNISLAEIVRFTLDRYPIPVHQLHIWKHSTKSSPELLSIYISVASKWGTMCWQECVFFSVPAVCDTWGFRRTLLFYVYCLFYLYDNEVTRLSSARPPGASTCGNRWFPIVLHGFTVLLMGPFRTTENWWIFEKKAVKLNLAIENQPMSDHLLRDDGDPMQEPVSSCPKIH